MTNEIEVLLPAAPEGESLADLTSTQALAELGESVGNTERVGDRPAHVPMRTWVKVACILAVQEWQIEHTTQNVARACRETGWRRPTYYKCLRDPAVIQYVAHHNFEMDSLGARRIDEAWMEVIESQIAIATNVANGQAATRAATWIAEQRKQYLEKASVVAREAEQQEGSDRLGRIAARFGAELKEKTVTTRTVKLPAE